ncbi:MAG: TIGR00341 family protein [Actinomycetota bacterium]
MVSSDDSPTNELDDAARIDEANRWSRLDLRRLGHPDAVRQLAGIAVAILVLVLPDRSTLVLGRLVGIGLIIGSLTTLWSITTGSTTEPIEVAAPTRRRDRWRRIAFAVLGLGLGGFLLVVPTRTELALGRIIGTALALTGLVGVLRVIRWRERTDLGWRLTSALSLIAIGSLVALFPQSLLATSSMIIAMTWIVFSFISLGVLLDPDRDPDTESASTVHLVAEWFAERPKSVEDRQTLYAQLLYEGSDANVKITRFVVLMVFASTIAATGVVADSTAVVVGAMLIAPLMNPLMGAALSLVMGWPNRLARSALIALGGVAIAITVGLLVGLAEFVVVDTLTNSQIVSRTSPTIVDLVIAVAAGVAGAYGWSRPDVSNSLPGVAIAIALVPPLTVVGISWSQGDFDSGNGALLLFATNAIAIVVVGGVVFLLTGVAPLEKAAENQKRVRTALVGIGGAGALVSIGLLVNGTSIATDAFEQNTVSRTVNEWIQPFDDHTVIDSTLDADVVEVVLAGPDADDRDLPDADELAEQLSDALDRDVTVDLRIRLEIRQTSGG